MNRAIRTTVAFLLIVRLVDETTGFLAPASVEQFRTDLGIGYGIAGAMFVAYGLGGLFGVMAVARTDGKSRKTVTWTGAMVLAVSLAVIGAAQSAPWLLAGAFLDATGATMLVHGGEISIANALAAAGLGNQLERRHRALERVRRRGRRRRTAHRRRDPRRRSRLAAVVPCGRRARRGVRHRAQPFDVPGAGRGHRRRR